MWLTPVRWSFSPRAGPGGGCWPQTSPEVGPKQVHDLLPVEAVIRGQREQLHHARGLPEPPFVLADKPEPTETSKWPSKDTRKPVRTSVTGSPFSCNVLDVVGYEGVDSHDSKAGPYTFRAAQSSGTSCLQEQQGQKAQVD